MSDVEGDDAPAAAAPAAAPGGAMDVMTALQVRPLFHLMLAVHYGPEQPRIQTEVLGHSLVRLLVRPDHSLICLLHTACFAYALRRAHWFIHHSRARGKVND